MSKEIDLSNPDALSDEEKMYLQDRNIMDFGLKPQDIDSDKPDPSGKGDSRLPDEPVSGDVSGEDDGPDDDDDEFVDDDYSSMTKEELAEELESRGLPKSGTKDEMIARLEEDDQED